MDALSLHPPNTMPRVQELYAIVSRDAQDKEAICGSVVRGMGYIPLVTASLKNLEMFRGLATQILLTAPPGYTFRVVKFTRAEEMEELKL